MKNNNVKMKNNDIFIFHEGGPFPLSQDHVFRYFSRNCTTVDNPGTGYNIVRLFGKPPSSTPYGRSRFLSRTNTTVDNAGNGYNIVRLFVNHR